MAAKRNIITIIVLFIYLLVVMQFHSQLLFTMEETYEIYPYRFLIVLLYILLGMLLGYLSCQENFHSKGRWKFKPLFFILLCIPSLYLSFYFLIHHLPIGSLPSFISEPYFKTRAYPLFSSLFGFGLMMSFYRTTDKG